MAVPLAASVRDLWPSASCDHQEACPGSLWTLQLANRKKSQQVWLDSDGQKHGVLLWKRLLTLNQRGPERDSDLSERAQHTVVDQVESGPMHEPGGGTVDTGPAPGLQAPAQCPVMSSDACPGCALILQAVIRGVKWEAARRMHLRCIFSTQTRALAHLGQGAEAPL